MELIIVLLILVLVVNFVLVVVSERTNRGDQ